MSPGCVELALSYGPLVLVMVLVVVLWWCGGHGYLVLVAVGGYREQQVVGHGVGADGDAVAVGDVEVARDVLRSGERGGGRQTQQAAHAQTIPQDLTHTHARTHTHTLTHGDLIVACRLLHFMTFIEDKLPNFSDDPKYDIKENIFLDLRKILEIMRWNSGKDPILVAAPPPQLPCRGRGSRV